MLKTDIAVLGSGPGGSTVAAILAEAGRETLLVEEGPFLSQRSCSPYSAEELQTKCRDGGISVTTGPARIAFVEGRCVGGGSEVNSGLYHRPPESVLAQWREELRIQHFEPRHLEPHFTAIEQDLGISFLKGPAPEASLRLKAGATSLGWDCREIPRWFRENPDGTSTRRSMSETLVPRFLSAGGRILAHSKAWSLSPTSGGWSIELVQSPKPGFPEVRRITVLARTVFAACGAIQTPCLLRRSGIRRNVGDRLRFHPMIKVAARFGAPVNTAGMGVPVHQVRQFAPGCTLGCSVSTPAHLALNLLPYPEVLRELPETWPTLANYYASTTGGKGSVRALPLTGDPWVRYSLTPEDETNLATGLRRLCECLLAAGAKALYPAIPGLFPIRTLSDLDRLPDRLPAKTTPLTSVHLMGTCPAGEHRGVCGADSWGKIFGHEGLYVADASLLGGAPGVNQQGSVMLWARRNAFAFLQKE